MKAKEAILVRCQRKHGKRPNVGEALVYLHFQNKHNNIEDDDDDTVRWWNVGSMNNNLIHSKYLIIAWNVFKLNKYSAKAYHMRKSKFVLTTDWETFVRARAHWTKGMSSTTLHVDMGNDANDVEARVWVCCSVTFEQNS